jgi:hypothetical protein
MPVEVAATYDSVAKVWWAYSWRWLALGAVAFLLICFPLMFLSNLLHFNHEATGNLMTAITFLISFLAAPQWVFHRLLTKGFGSYRIALVEK